MPVKSRERRHSRPKIVLVVACSSRKSELPHPSLRVADIEGSVGDRRREWVRRLRTVDSDKKPARQLYGGDHWCAATRAFDLITAWSPQSELWIASAGYGLVSASASLKPYGATFSSRHEDSIWRGPEDGDRRSVLRAWWADIGEAQLTALVDEPHARLVIVAGGDYIDAMADDLALARRELDPEHLTIVCAGRSDSQGALGITREHRAGLGGTVASLNARILLCLAERPRDHLFLRSKIAQIIETLPVSQSPATRQRLSDREVIATIRVIRKDVSGISRTSALRELRSRGLACEQGRFAEIWDHIASAA